MSTVQRVAQIFGWIFVVVAIWGFVVSGGSMEADPEMAPKVMGLFAVNLLHNIVHLLFGVWGIMAARSHASARTYALVSGTIYLVLTIMGFLTPTTFGLIPIGGNDIWLHALIAVVLLGAGVSAKADDSSAAMAGEPRATPPAGGTGTSPGGSTTMSSPPPTTPDRPASPPPPPPSGGSTGGTMGGSTGGEGDRPA